MQTFLAGAFVLASVVSAWLGVSAIAAALEQWLARPNEAYVVFILGVLLIVIATGAMLALISLIRRMIK